MVWSNGLVEEKIKVGLLVPAPIWDAINAIAARRSGKEKWIYVTAALASFAMLTHTQQDTWFSRVRNADNPGHSFAELLRPLDQDMGTDGTTLPDPPAPPSPGPPISRGLDQERHDPPRKRRKSG
jgi:hypothetical protein